MRNRRLRRLGLLPEGPLDRLLGPTREIEDTLTPPKLLEARIAHDFRPAAYDAEVKAKGWDAVMPISAAVPPVLYSDLFPKPNTADTDVPTGVADAASAAQNDFAYPPTSSLAGGLTRHLHIPSFLRRNGEGSSHDDAAAASNNGTPNNVSANGSDAEAKNARADTSTPASVNVTVLIAMPCQRTVFPSTQHQYNHAALKSQRSLNIDGVASNKIVEVEESASGHQGGGLRRTASMKSFRTAASIKSIGDARREAFFNKMNEQEGNNAAQNVAAINMDDEDEEELPELVFGTASVPIFVRIPGASASAAGREPFAGALEAYQPLRSELTRLVASAHEARERKAAMEAAAKQVEKDAANVDDGQTTIDERSTSNNPGQTDAAINSGAVGSNGHRVSASETIDSETAVILGSAGLASVPAAAHQDGLGDVVSRMMAQPAHPTISESSVVPAPAILSGVQPDRFTEAPRPSIGVNSNLSRDETLLTLPDHDAAEPYNTSTITLDPLLGDTHTHTHTRTETNNG